MDKLSAIESEIKILDRHIEETKEERQYELCCRFQDKKIKLMEEKESGQFEILKRLVALDIENDSVGEDWPELLEIWKDAKRVVDNGY
jgi:hypothetical protein